jgi:hypothetical protein
MKACKIKLAAPGYFGIVVWYNSWLVTPLKFQRGGRSSVSTKDERKLILGWASESHNTTNNRRQRRFWNIWWAKNWWGACWISNITHAFFDDDGAPNSTEAETAANAVLDPAVLAALPGIAPAEDDLEEDTEQEEEEEPTESDKVEVEITVGKPQFGKVFKIRVSPFCIKDVGAYGRKKMVDSDVSALRHRRKQRLRRERLFLQTNLLNTLNGTMGSRTRYLVMQLDTGELQEQPCFLNRFNSTNY